MTPFRRLDLFCRVVDNYGDIGICWRLARQLVREHGLTVSLFVDDLASFRRICPAVDVAADRQQVDGVTVQHWRDQDGVYTPADVADIVVEFFAVDIPPGYINAMAQCQPRPVWLNLEGLTAEEWVEGCHRLPSPQAQSLMKHFFFPGFTDKTGGLLREAELEQLRLQFEPAAFLSQLGLTAAEQAATKISLFCYPHAPVSALFEVWQNGKQPMTCLVPDGVAADAVRAFIGGEGRVATHGALTVRVLPFVPQPDYDKLLWACDLNFVRGEDSFVRAQWAGKPFIWHIYPQDENLHHKKLRAFLQRYAASLPGLADFSLRWNGAPVQGDADSWAACWAALAAETGAASARAAEWQRQMLAHGDLASNMLSFAASLR
ncbi:elongation factor P maturation arginine rhamnosyltransferase EarP [Duganella sp.]|uniref:elongation factor P maturation arginine rhamnosyltransferase EarP n=1 Tax=Duganella sp. TaxID=1904440 RepID=UPI0031DF90F9